MYRAKPKLTAADVRKEPWPCLSTEPFGQVWTLGPELGTGAYAVVHSCTHKLRAGHVGAVKIFEQSLNKLVGGLAVTRVGPVTFKRRR